MRAIILCARDYLENFEETPRAPKGKGLEYITYFVHFILQIGKKFRTSPESNLKRIAEFDKVFPLSLD